MTEVKLEDLKAEIPFKWRVQSYSKYKAEATCVAYLDSRQVQDLLDSVVGPENWQDKYYECKGNLFCSIGIRIKGIWRWKTDCGTESNVDKQKGEASDAFKRAAVKWGVGRFLYSKDMVKLPTNEKKAGNNNPYIIDSNGNRMWGDLTNYINGGNYGTGATSQPKQADKSKAATERELSSNEVSQKWNGKIYGDFVYIDNQKIKPPADQLGRLKKHEKYKPMA